MVRYRNFRTLTTPSPAQFMCLATDPAGEIVAAGAMEPFDVYVWSLQTGKLLDVLSGHEGPVSSVSFSSSLGMLASGSWDKTVKLWDVFAGNAAPESLSHGADVLAVRFRPDGKQLVSSTLDGQLHFWDAKAGREMKTIDGRRDIRGGRKSTDVRTAKSSAAGKCFTSMCYTADGECVIAGGRSKFVCIYSVESGLLLRKYQLSHNRSLEGVLDKLNTRGIKDGEVLATLDLSGSEDERDRLPDESLPGTRRGDLSSRKARPEIRSKCVEFSPSGEAWAAATTEGMMVFGSASEEVFDPFDLDEDVTPAAVASAMRGGRYARALLMALHLSDDEFIM
jgi:periodic tryptophan protein 2